jgi:cytochrome c-type biogenesis protein CcmF
MEYQNEHLLPGQLGHLCAVLSFVAALLSTGAFVMAVQKRNTSEEYGWRNLGRFGWLLHGLTTFGVIGTLFYILVNKHYEYQYAFANVSDDLPFQYVFSAFWKEQQGSFLLWSFWHIALGLILMVRGGRWEAPVLAVMAFAEVFIASMLLGLYFGEGRFGASPFDLLRHTTDAPIFAQADYLTKVKGQGLNPLLQNYWMTIHPPTLFLGFASTIVPFAFAIAGLWTREHKAWLRPALQWSLFSGAILGLGILMGGAWAYEALSFAGYWAWDPVENTSLVPWIVMVAGIHTNLVARNTGYSIRSTYGFYLLSFILILYSTYLTRSGILGDTSAHAFTEMGLGLQLVLFIGTFSLLGLGLYISRVKGIPDVKAEEKANSREFWMFMGALVLFFSAILITGATSLPVWNKIVQAFDPGYDGAALKDPAEHHNRYQLWIAVFMSLLSGVAQWLRYNERNWAVWQRKVLIHLGVAVLGALALTFLNKLWIDISAWQVYTMLFAGMFTLVSNADYLISFAKGNLKMAASAVSHMGFGILLLGILSTGLGKTWISSNSFAMEGLIEGMEGDELNKNVLLMKDSPLPVRKMVELTYLSDTIERQTRTFTVRFRRLDEQGEPSGETFILRPNVMYDRQFEKIVASNPSTQHYWNYDIFTHVSSLPKAEMDPEFAKNQDDSLRYERYDARIGDTIFTKKHYIEVLGLSKQPKHPDYHAEKSDLAFGLTLRAHSLENPNAYTVEPMICIRPGQGGFSLPSTIGPLQMKIRLSEAAIDRIFQAEANLKFQQFPLKEGQAFSYKGYSMVLRSIDQTVNHPNYTRQEGDIAVTARIDVAAPDGQKFSASPVYLIRDSRSYSLKDEINALGLHVQFENIDPKAGLMTIGIAETPEAMRSIPVEIAENVARSDYIVLEAIIFPGINLVWTGCLLMLLGLALGLWRRMTAVRE